MPPKTKSLLALDVGARRIGVALADSIARLARPLMTLENSPAIFDQLQKIINQESVESIIVGLPRDMNGQTTQQTRDTSAFVTELKAHVAFPIYMQDEAVTSHQAEAELKSKRKTYVKGDIDALAATYILEDYLREHQEVAHG